MKQVLKPSKVRRILKRTLTILFGVLATLIVAVLLIANSQDGSVRLLQAYLYKTLWDYPPNAFEPRSKPVDEVRSDGLRVRTNLRYGEQYPNSYFDLWLPSAEQGAKRPLVVFIHGGGWFMGDKDTGDPLAGGTAREPLELAKQGLAVVNLNYALAPEYRHPVQLIQLNQALQHLVDHADEYGVDMSRVVVMGGSAGAHMSAQYGLLASDPAYATEIGIRPVLDTSSLKAVVLFAAPLKFSGFDWRMNAMLWSYLGTKDLENSSQARRVDILSHVGPHYPATYITDGNQPDTFPEHAKAMARLLRENNVEHVFNYYEPSEALLDHGYTGRLDTKHGRENLEKAIDFIQQRTGLSRRAAAGVGPTD